VVTAIADQPRKSFALPINGNVRVYWMLAATVRNPTKIKASGRCFAVISGIQQLQKKSI